MTVESIADMLDGEGAKFGLREYEIHDPSCRVRGRSGPCRHCSDIDERRQVDKIAMLAEWEG